MDKDISTILCMSSLIYKHAVSKYMEYINGMHAAVRLQSALERISAH
jgi:sRNA-binding regulator protein Hfq